MARWCSSLAPATIAALSTGAAIFLNLALGHALERMSLALNVAGIHVSLPGTRVIALGLIAVVTAINCAPAVVNGRITSASAAVIGALYAYNGWNAPNWVAGEVKNRGRTMPVALVASVAIVTVLYAAANAAFVFVLGPVAIENSSRVTSVGIIVVKTLFGTVWQSIAAAFLFASTTATLHVAVLALARVTFAFSQGREAPGLLGRSSRRGHVPVNAVLANGALATVLALVGSIDTLSNYLIFNTWVFFVAAGAAVFVLRRREPAMPRPYRALGYPVVPAAFIAVGAWLVIQTLLSSRGPSLIGLAIVAAAVLVFLWRRRSRPVSP